MSNTTEQNNSPEKSTSVEFKNSSQNSIEIPIVNVYAKGDYCAQVFIGHRKESANLILDTGSSTLVVQSEDYNPADDKCLTATVYAQSITYGMGGWFGPVVKTKVSMGSESNSVELDDVNVAVAHKEQPGNFMGADGILGLAYYELNKAYDLSEYLNENNIKPAFTYPWFLADEQQDDSVKEFKKFLKDYPREYLTPYFTQLETQGVVANQFAFYVHRSSVYQTDSKRPLETLEQHPLNQGLFVLGMPRQHKQLYQGEFKKVKVLDDKYYNVHVESLQVGQCAARKAPLLKQINRRYRSNGIMDTGASAIVLPKSLFDQMLEDFKSINPQFDTIIEPYKTFEGVEEGVDASLLDLAQWPDITITLEGFDDESVELVLTPECYWQMHAPEPNQASFQFVFLENWPNQCILGLPIMTRYYTIFDRRECEFGGVFFAEKK
jgi:hypothetical protein